MSFAAALQVWFMYTRLTADVWVVGFAIDGGGAPSRSDPPVWYVYGGGGGIVT